MGCLKSYNFHDIFFLQIYRDIKTPFDTYLDAVFAYYETDQPIEPDLIVSLQTHHPDLTNCFWVDGKYAIRENFIHYENRYKSARWSLSIEGLESAQTTVRIQANLLARPVLAGETLISLIRYKLAQKGYALLHASGVSIDDKGLFFAARGGVGKTITAISSVRRGARLYGDDTVILGKDGKMYGFAVPFNLRFTYDIKKLLGVQFSWKTRVELALKKLISIMSFGHYRLFTILRADKVFPKAMGRSTTLTTGFIFLRGPKFEIEDEPNRSLFLHQLMHIVRFESSELIGMLLAYRHIFPHSSVVNFWDQFYQILESATEGIRTSRVTIPKLYKPEYFENLWQKISQCEPSITTSTT
jgi:hypothetical protein